MEEVAKDIGGTWYFKPAEDGGKAVYICLDANGDKVGKLYPEHVPDPDTIWERKCKFEEVQPNSHKGKMLKPSQTVYKLWEHVNANFNQ